MGFPQWQSPNLVLHSNQMYHPHVRVRVRVWCHGYFKQQRKYGSALVNNSPWRRSTMRQNFGGGGENLRRQQRRRRRRPFRHRFSSNWPLEGRRMQGMTGRSDRLGSRSERTRGRPISNPAHLKSPSLSVPRRVLCMARRRTFPCGMSGSDSACLALLADCQHTLS